jgi:hypothetical protein
MKLVTANLFFVLQFFPFLIFAKKRATFDSSEIDEKTLARSYEKGDDIEISELPATDERKKFEGIDWGKTLQIQPLRMFALFRKSESKRSHNHAQIRF